MNLSTLVKKYMWNWFSYSGSPRYSRVFHILILLQENVTIERLTSLEEVPSLDHIVRQLLLISDSLRMVLLDGYILVLPFEIAK